MMATLSLMGAERRLLPPILPVMLFGTALVCHLLFWLGLGLVADDAVVYAGGLGPVLAVIHLLTVGVLVVTSCGAGLQILAVVSGKAPPRPLFVALLVPVLLGGVGALVSGFSLYSLPLSHAGSGLLTIALGALAVMLLPTLRAMPGDTFPTSAFWLRLAAISALLVPVLALTALITGAPDIAALHMTIALFGFMGGLVFGLSHLLVPMLALSSPAAAVEDRWARRLVLPALGCLAAGLTSLPARIGLPPTLLVMAGGVLLLAVSVFHALTLWAVIRRRARKKLDTAFRLLPLSWILLPGGLATGLLALSGALPDTLSGPAELLAGWLLLPGWLLTVLTGLLQRILPFLASMHSSRLASPPATVSSLGWPRILQLHAVAHSAALALGAGALILGNALVMQAAAACGALGAACLILFAASVLRSAFRHVRSHPKPPRPSSPPSPPQSGRLAS